MDENKNKTAGGINAKLKLLLNGAIKKVKQSRIDKSKIPEEVGHLEELLTKVLTPTSTS